MGQRGIRHYRRGRGHLHGQGGGGRQRGRVRPGRHVDAIEAGAQQWAARHGLMMVTPDTSPRNTGVAGADQDWDFGHGAGFYLDATEAPYARHWRMETYVTKELPQVVAQHFGASSGAAGIFGHSMGGHGALTLALRHPGLYRSVSAVDQGSADQFLESQLRPQLLEAACTEAGQPLQLRRHEGYDHGYFFVATFVADHLAHHAGALYR